jgi:hypothetical protein
MSTLPWFSSHPQRLFPPPPKKLFNRWAHSLPQIRNFSYLGKFSWQCCRHQSVLNLALRWRLPLPMHSVIMMMKKIKVDQKYLIFLANKCFSFWNMAIRNIFIIYKYGKNFPFCFCIFGFYFVCCIDVYQKRALPTYIVNTLGNTCLGLPPKW